MPNSIFLIDNTESKLQFVNHLECSINFNSIYLHMNNIHIISIYNQSLI